MYDRISGVVDSWGKEFAPGVANSFLWKSAPFLMGFRFSSKQTGSLIIIPFLTVVENFDVQAYTLIYPCAVLLSLWVRVLLPYYYPSFMLVDVFTVFRICVNNIIISAFVDDSIGHLYIKSIWKILYHKSCKYSDREAGAHSVDPYHTAPMGAVWLGLHCVPLLIWLFYLLLASTLLHLEICVPFFW